MSGIPSLAKSRGRKVCVSERRQITALTMLHIDSHNCRTSTIILRNMPRQGEAPRESRAPPDTALWHMVFTALFTHKGITSVKLWSSDRVSCAVRDLCPLICEICRGHHFIQSLESIRRGLPLFFLYTQFINGENVSFGIYHKTGGNLTWWQVATEGYTAKSWLTGMLLNKSV